MKLADLHKMVGKDVTVVFFDGDVRSGVLGYADTFSAEHGYRKPNYFYIDDMSFKVSHIKKIKEKGE